MSIGRLASRSFWAAHLQGGPLNHTRLTLVAMALFASSCTVPSGRNAASSQSAFVSAPVSASLGNLYSRHIEIIGLATVELASGSVSFCMGSCYAIGKLGPIEVTGASISEGGEARFFVTNAARGPIALCTLKMEYDERWVFKSGQCAPIALSGRAGTTDKQ